MTTAKANLLQTIDEAFKNRQMPTGRIILSDVDLGYHVEAKRLDEYLRKHRGIVDHGNYPQVAFNYLTPEAAIWIIPSFMKYIMNSCEDDDFVVITTVGALATGMPKAVYKARGQIGVEMKALATPQERCAILQFLDWISSFAPDVGLDETLSEAKKLWSSKDS